MVPPAIPATLSGYMAPGAKVRIPFALNEADIAATVVVPDDLPVFDVALETPAGDIITPPPRQVSA